MSEKKCLSCGKEGVKKTLLKNEGVVMHVEQCPSCKMWKNLICPICQKPITSIKNECTITGFVEGYEFSHITCLFDSASRVVVIASMVHDAFNKALVAEGMPEKAVPWWKLDPQTKELAIKNVRGIDEYFKRWDDGYKMASKILSEIAEIDKKMKAKK